MGSSGLRGDSLPAWSPDLGSLPHPGGIGGGEIVGLCDGLAAYVSRECVNPAKEGRADCAGGLDALFGNEQDPGLR